MEGTHSIQFVKHENSWLLRVAKTDVRKRLKPALNFLSCVSFLSQIFLNQKFCDFQGICGVYDWFDGYL